MAGYVEEYFAANSLSGQVMNTVLQLWKVRSGPFEKLKDKTRQTDDPMFSLKHAKLTTCGKANKWT